MSEKMCRLSVESAKSAKQVPAGTTMRPPACFTTFPTHFCSFSTFKKKGVTDGRTDGPTDGRTDGPTNRWKDGWTDGRTRPLIEM